MDSIEISFVFDNQSDQSLVKLWKLTQNDFVSSKFTSSERLNNRIWRILNKKVLIGSSKQSTKPDVEINKMLPLPDNLTPFPTISNTANIDRSIGDLSRDSLSNLAPRSSQFLSERPSLFSHNSNLSLHSNRKSTNNSSLDSYNAKECTENAKSGIPDSEQDEDDDEDDFEDDYDDSISDISDISEEGEGDDDFEEAAEDAEDITASMPKNDALRSFSIDTSVSQAQNCDNNSVNSGGPRSFMRSRTSFVRGFSPSQVSISPISPFPGKPLPLESNQEKLDQNDSSKSNKNIFFIANSISPPTSNLKSEINKPLSSTKSPKTSPGNQESNPSRPMRHSQPNPSTNTSRPSITQPPIQRHNSLFSNFQMQFKKDDGPKVSPKLDERVAPETKEEGYSSTDISEDDDEEDGDVSEDEDHEIPTQLENNSRISYFSNSSKASSVKNQDRSSYPNNTNKIDSYNSKKGMVLNRRERGSSTTTQMTTDNESEWLSVSSEDDDSKSTDELKFGPLKFAKIPTLTKITSNSSVTTDIVEPEDEQRKQQERNGFSFSPISSKPRSLLSGLFLNELANQQGQLPTHTNKLYPKPILKRSSTTGVITFDQSKIATNGQIKQTGQAKEACDKPKRPYIMFTKKYNSSTDISKNYPHFQNNLVRKDILQDEDTSDNESDQAQSREDGDASTDSIIGKQKSIVGISDFNVTASSSSSKVDEVIDSKHASEFKKASSIHSEPGNSHAVLSTSLNKLSGSSTNHSIRNLLSKSSMSLTKLYNNPRLIFGKGEGKSASSPARDDQPNDNDIIATTSLPEAESTSSDMPGLDALTQTPHPGSPNSTSTPISTTPGKGTLPYSKTITGSDEKLGLDVKKKGFRMSPKSTRRSMLSTELSKSLKESIIIDYKLGKVPLPKKVVASETQHEIVAGDNDLDDYHSKGW